MKTIIIALVAALVVTGIHAEEPMKFPSLLDYQNVTITKVDPDGIRITHDDGTAKIPIEAIPEDLKAKLGMTMTAANEHREVIEARKDSQLAAARAREALARAQVKDDDPEARKHRISFNGIIFRITADGVILRDVIYADGKKVEKKVARTVVTDGPTVLNPKRPVKSRTDYVIESVLDVKNMPCAFVECNITGLTDGQVFSANVFPAGKYTFETPDGKVIVPAFTTSFRKFLNNKPEATTP